MDLEHFYDLGILAPINPIQPILWTDVMTGGNYGPLVFSAFGPPHCKNFCPRYPRNPKARDKGTTLLGHGTIKVMVLNGSKNRHYLSGGLYFIFGSKYEKLGLSYTKCK